MVRLGRQVSLVPDLDVIDIRLDLIAVPFDLGQVNFHNATL